MNNLEQIVKKYYEMTLGTDPIILKSLANSEQYLKEVYEGRYLLELLQNARDAAMLNNENGCIRMNLANNILDIANTGVAFTDEGYRSIMEIGESSKDSKDFIGHKGLGFKSVIQISDKPKIITADGSIYFDREQVYEKHFKEVPDFSSEKVPLFFFPNYQPHNITEESGYSDYTTLIRLPLRDSVSPENIISDLNNISGDQLLLLGFIKKIKFTHGAFKKDIEIIPSEKNLVIVKENENESYFKVYQPKELPIIDDELYAQLEPKEKELFQNDRELDLKIVLSLDSAQRPDLESNPKLYLFYPLDITSGFEFIIHAYFSVDPQRKGLRDTALNKFLISKIADFITGEFLEQIKTEYPERVVEILSFYENHDAGLEELYSVVRRQLREKKCIYDTFSKKFYKPSEVYTVFEKQLEVFDDRVFDRKQLISHEKNVADWLLHNLGVQQLSTNAIFKGIEQYCQGRINEPRFFNKLYRYFSQTQRDYKGLKILLTPFNTLLSGDGNHIFTRDKDDGIELSQGVSQYVTFIHPDINFGDYKRLAIKYLGIREFNTANLATRLMQVFKKAPTLRIDIIRTLFNLEWNPISKRTLYADLRLPVKGREEWVSPLYEPIYFEIEAISGLYPNANFIDKQILIKDDNDEVEWDSFLKKLLVWNSPALYIVKEYIVPNPERIRSNLFIKIANKHSLPFTVYNDRLIDIPKVITSEFYNLIKENWISYNHSRLNDDFPQMKCKSHHQTYSNVVAQPLSYSQFLWQLRNMKWIPTKDSEKLLAPSEVVAINAVEYSRSSKKNLKVHLPLVILDWDKDYYFIQNMKIIHLQGIYSTLHNDTINNYVNLLRLVKKLYPIPLQTNEFRKFYHSLLGYLFDAYTFLSKFNDYQIQLINKIKQVDFLCTDESKNNLVLEWRIPSQIHHNDNNSLYESLPPEIFKEVQPVFTKRDKNEFGRIAKRIGRSIENGIEESLKTVSSKKGIVLVKEFPQLAMLICLFESMQSEKFSNKQLDKIKSSNWIKEEKISVELTVTTFEGKVKSVFTSPKWYVDSDDDGYFVLVTRSELFTLKGEKLERNIQIFPTRLRALSNLFESISGNEVVGFELYAEKLLAPNFKITNTALYNEFDISSHRIEEVQDILNDTIFTPMQSFWNAVFLALNIDTDKPIPEPKEKLLQFIVMQLGDTIELHEIEAFNNGIDFFSLNSISNREMICELFEKLNMRVKDFNQYNNDRIDFRPEFLRKLLQSKNKMKPFFYKWLHQTLKQNDSYVSYRTQFEQLLENYTKEPEINFTEDELNPDLEKELEVHFKNIYPEFNPIILEIEKEKNRNSPLWYFNKNKREFVSNLARQELDLMNVDDFLNDIKKKSMLYFESPIEWVEEYRVKYQKVENEEDEAEIDLGFDDEPFTEAEIDDIGITEVEEPSGDLEITDTEGETEDTSGNSQGGNGGHSWRPTSQNFKDDIGFKGEFLVYKKLVKVYGEDNVEWVSLNGEKAGEISRGNDTLGYDIRYIDEDGNENYTEVKASAKGGFQFQISQKEVNFGLKNKDNYELWLVLNVLDISKVTLNRYGQFFKFNDDEDFFRNRKFSAKASNYYIELK